MSRHENSNHYKPTEVSCLERNTISDGLKQKKKRLSEGKGAKTDRVSKQARYKDQLERGVMYCYI